MAKTKATSAGHETGAKSGASGGAAKKHEQQSPEGSSDTAQLRLKGREPKVEPSTERRSERARNEVNYAQRPPRYILQDPEQGHDARKQRKQRKQKVRAGRTTSASYTCPATLQQSFTLTGTSAQESNGGHHATQASLILVRPFSATQVMAEGTQGDAFSTFTFGTPSESTRV